jgi:hypothetical protein
MHMHVCTFTQLSSVVTSVHTVTTATVERMEDKLECTKDTAMFTHFACLYGPRALNPLQNDRVTDGVRKLHTRNSCRKRDSSQVRYTTAVQYTASAARVSAANNHSHSRTPRQPN